jgi:hypothetical protein
MFYEKRIHLRVLVLLLMDGKEEQTEAHVVVSWARRE